MVRRAPRHLVAVVAVVVVSLGCGPTYLFPGSPKAPRVLLLDGVSIRELRAGDFQTWACFDYVSEAGLAIEVGLFHDGTGFVLYDGTDTGTSANYERRGPNRRWDWGPNGNDFAFVLKPDRVGLFYDLKSATTNKKADDVFKCRERRSKTK
jgi:hypothetical protein